MACGGCARRRAVLAQVLAKSAATVRGLGRLVPRGDLAADLAKGGEPIKGAKPAVRLGKAT